MSGVPFHFDFIFNGNSCQQTVQTLIRHPVLCLQFAKVKKPEDHWSCIAHLSAEDMLKSAVIEEKKFKHSLWAGADNPSGSKFLLTRRPHHYGHCCKFKKEPLQPLTLYTSFHDLINV